MQIPEFPDSRPIELEDKPLIDALLAERQPEISAYTFTNLFAWRQPHGVRLSRIGGSVLPSYTDHGHTCLEPLGGGDAVETVREAFSRSPEIEFGYISEGLAQRLRRDGSLQVTQDRDNQDYLYLAQDLISLQGRKYDGKRNFVNRFHANSPEYARIDGALAAECLEFAHEWCEERSCETVEGMRREQCAVFEMLTHFEALGIVGGALLIDGRIVAFSLGEKLNRETLVVHVEKANASIEGSYQAMNNEFCIHEAADLKYVNREQDLGVPGLRKAKESYHPVRLVETYRVRRGG